MLKGKDPEAKIKQFGIGKLKPKNTLVKDLSTLYRLLKKRIDDL